MGGDEEGVSEGGEFGEYFLDIYGWLVGVMIFVTVGTHEQQFDRLVRTVDKLRENGDIDEEIIVQTGYSTYEPRFCKWSKLYPYHEMVQLATDARIVVTHGGPSSFIMPLRLGKVPIVVPRQKRFGEHVNNHQMEFCRAVKERMGNIIVVEDIGELVHNIVDYEIVVKDMQGMGQSCNAVFNSRIQEMVNRMF